MKKYIYAICLGIGLSSQAQYYYGQEENPYVGINTYQPAVSLDIAEDGRDTYIYSYYDPIDANSPKIKFPQGVIFPHLSTDERNSFTGHIEEGTMIYNTTKRCVELYTYNGLPKLGWHCLCDCYHAPAISTTFDIIKPECENSKAEYTLHPTVENIEEIGILDTSIQGTLKLDNGITRAVTIFISKETEDAGYLLIRIKTNDGLPFHDENHEGTIDVSKMEIIDNYERKIFFNGLNVKIETCKVEIEDEEIPAIDE